MRCSMTPPQCHGRCCQPPATLPPTGICHATAPAQLSLGVRRFLAHTIMTVTEQVTFGIALIGAVLGLLNTWRSFDRDRLRLTISPRWAYFPSAEPRLCFEVINFSYIPVTVTTVGLRLRRPHHGSFFAFIPTVINGERLPHRMEPRASITVLMPPGAHEDKEMREVRDAFVKTACGRTFRGNSPVLKRHVKRLRTATVSTSDSYEP